MSEEADAFNPYGKRLLDVSGATLKNVKYYSSIPCPNTFYLIIQQLYNYHSSKKIHLKQQVTKHERIKKRNLLIIFYFIIGSTKAMPRLQSKDKYVLHDSSLKLYLTKLLQNLMTVSPQHVTTDQQSLTNTRLMITVQQYTCHVTMLNLGSDL